MLSIAQIYPSAFVIGLLGCIAWVSWIVWKAHKSKARRMAKLADDESRSSARCPKCRKPMTVGDTYNEYPSDFGPVCKACFLELNDEWELFTKDYDYYKMFYDVMLEDGEIIEHCWPNAGFMNAVMRKDGRTKFGPEDNIQVRVSRTHPMDD